MDNVQQENNNSSSYQDKRQIFIPNEIFDDLKNAFGEKNASHIAFAYSYHYYITYLYRYAIYGMESKQYTQGQIKSDLGFHEKNKKLDYIIKKNGILDELGYTKSTTNYPIDLIVDDFSEYLVDDSSRRFNYHIDFLMINDVRDRGLFPSTRNFHIKYPVKAFYRDQEAEEDGVWNGTFFEVKNTHRISVNTFFKAMKTDGVGTLGFYVYSYLKMKSATLSKSENYVGGYSVAHDVLSMESTVKSRKLYDFIAALEKNEFIRVKRDESARKKDEGYKVLPNIYYTLLD